MLKIGLQLVVFATLQRYAGWITIITNFFTVYNFLIFTLEDSLL